VAAWLAWLIVAGVLGVAELLTLTLVLGMLSVAALAAAVASGLGAPSPLGVVVFAAGGVLLLAVARPVARRHRHLPPELRTGTAALVGRRAVVVSDVDAVSGRVRVGGEIWSARRYDGDTPIPAGRSVDVVQIDGATAVVLPVDPL
jgi:membrane protein implicated in regulation of membrane protease activity